MFKGNYSYSIDSKGRVSIPAKMRKHVSADANDTFVMTQGVDGCIDVYPLDQWSLFENKLKDLNPFNPKDAKFIRLILQHATEDTLDSQSRILIPQRLLEYAKIEKEVLIIGTLRKIEIWNPNIYEEYLKSSNDSYEDIASQVMRG